MSFETDLAAASAALVTYDTLAAAYVALLTQNPPASQQAKDDALNAASLALDVLLGTQAPIDSDYADLNPGWKANRPSPEKKNAYEKAIRKRGHEVLKGK